MRTASAASSRWRGWRRIWTAIGYLADRYNEWTGGDSFYYFQFHHILAHNLPASVVIAACAAWLAATRRGAVFAAALLVVHLHFLCDVIGSRGPDGYQWPIPYLLPFSRSFEWTWSGQWELNGWQNFAITLAMLAVCAVWSFRQRYSFIEAISARLDRAFFKIVARRLGERR